METKEIKIQVPDGYEIDKENSTFECIKFKHINNGITYEDECNKLFKKFQGYLISGQGEIENFFYESDKFESNSATNRNQLDRLLALNQLLNITEYYNRLHIKTDKGYNILYDMRLKDYRVDIPSVWRRKNLSGIEAIFNKAEDAQAVINNPNFREILDMIYKTV